MSDLCQCGHELDKHDYGACMWCSCLCAAPECTECKQLRADLAAARAEVERLSTELSRKHADLRQSYDGAIKAAWMDALAALRERCAREIETLGPNYGALLNTVTKYSDAIRALPLTEGE